MIRQSLLLALVVLICTHSALAQFNDDALTGKSPMVSGTVRSATDAIPAVFSVFIAESGTVTPMVRATTKDDGTFRLEPDARIRAGVYVLCFAAPDHEILLRKVYLTPETRGVRIDAILKTHRKRGEVFDSVLILAAFDDTTFARSRRMEEKSNGTYTSSVPLTAGSAMYQVIPFVKGVQVLDNRAISGTMQTAFEYDNGGDFRSIVKGKGQKILVTWNPSLAAQSDKPEKFTYQSPDDFLIDSVRAAFDARSNIVFGRTIDNKGDSVGTRRWRNNREQDASDELKKALNIPEGRVQDVALANVCLMYSPLTLLDPFENSFATILTDVIPPASNVWTVTDLAIVPIVVSASRESKFWDYVNEVIKAHPYLGADILYKSMEACETSANADMLGVLYKRFAQEYKESPLAGIAKSRFNPERN